MSDMETALAAMADEVRAAAKAAKDLSSALRKLGGAVETGQVGEIEKQAAAAARRGEEAAAAAAGLPQAWSFDARAHLADGYLDELRRAAAAAGLSLIEKDGRIYSFPLLLKLEPRDAAVRVERKLERRIRPAALVKQLVALQKRPQRFREEQFLELLYRAYELRAGRDWLRDGAGPGPVVALAELFEVLTLMPDSDYGVEEFGRDLLLLDRKPDLRTRAGLSFRFAGSTLGKGKARRIAVYDETGSERVYLALAFARDG